MFPSHFPLGRIQTTKIFLGLIGVAVDSIKKAVQKNTTVKVVGHVLILPQRRRLARAQLEQRAASIETGEEQLLADHDRVGDVDIPVCQPRELPELRAILHLYRDERFTGENRRTLLP